MDEASWCYKWAHIYMHITERFGLFANMNCISCFHIDSVSSLSTVCMDFLAFLVNTDLHVCWAVLAFLALCYSCASYSALARDLSRRLFCSFCSSCYLPFHCRPNLGLFTHLVYVPSLGRNILENIRCRHFVFFRQNLCKLGLVISLDGTEPIQDKSPVFGRLLL